MTEGTFDNDTGQRLFYRAWAPQAPACAIMALVPGFNAHSGYYGWVGEQLAKNGISAYALDLRGRGLSDGERFYVDSFDDYVSDLAGFLRLVKAREPGLPLYLLGHSAGGVVACLYASKHQNELAGLICESFAFRVPAPDAALAVLRGLSHLLPHAHVLKLKNSDFSRDPAAVSAMEQDQLIRGEAQPTQTIAAMVRADFELEQRFADISLPLFIMHGTADRATRPSGSQMFFENAGSRDKTLKLYEGAFHDPLNDIDKAVAMGDIVSWVRARVARASAA
ncbi:MAG TPA: alpha/beta hydrolase [Polyangiaceae bacterium]|nr:alpha/beta hydrolase [Polyangiaceae bacterium]